MANRITTLFDFREQGGGLKKIKADIAGVDGAWGKAKAGFKSSMNEFRSSNAAQGVAIAGLLAGAKKAVDSASDLEESANAVSTTYDKAADSIAALGEKAVDSYGLSTRGFNELAVAFSGFAEQVTTEGGDVAETVDDMATRVADFASVHNLELSDAMTKFQSALAGETEAMRRYGIDVSAATVETYAYSTGIAEAGAELTESEKVQARYGLLMQSTTKWAGDFAATSDSLANTQRRAAAEAENASAKLGEGLAPALAKATEGMIMLVEAADKLKILDAISLTWAEDLGTALGQVLTPWKRGAREANKAIVDAFKGAEKAVDDFDRTLFDGVKTVADAKRIAQEYADTLDSELVDTYHVVNALVVEFSSGSRDAAAAVGELEEAVEDAAEAFKDPGWEEYLQTQREINGMLEGAPGLFDDMAEAAKRGLDIVAEEAEEALSPFAELREQLENEKMFDRLADQLNAVKAKPGDRDETRRLLDLVLDLGEAYEDIPPEVITKIFADIDRGQVDAAFNELQRLADQRQVRLQIATGGTSFRINTDGSAPTRIDTPDMVTATSVTNVYQISPDPSQVVGGFQYNQFANGTRPRYQ